MKTVLKIPRINSNDDRVQIVKWLVEPFTMVEEGQTIAELGTSKAVFTVSADKAGFIFPQHRANSIAHIGDDLCTIADSLSEIEGMTLADDSFKGSGNQPARFSKEALAYLKARGMDPEEFKGKGLISTRVLNPNNLKRDVAHQQRLAAKDELARQAIELSKSDEEISLAKQSEIQALAQGQSGHINPSLTVHFNSAGLRETFKREGLFGTSVLPVVLYEIAQALNEHRHFCSFYYEDRIYYYDRVDIGVAMDIDRGLKVVTMREADKLAPAKIHERLLDFGVRYMKNTLEFDELTGSTATITDLSPYDIAIFRPLINGPQSIIFGIGGDSHQSDYPMTITATFDHRVHTGREVAELLQQIRKNILSHERLDSSETSSS